MATINPNDKYAFLFSGPIDPRQEKDLENVAETLVNYYNYPIGNIKIVLGTAPASPLVFSGITATTVTGLTALNSEMDFLAGFANTAGKTVLLYFTGWGDRELGVSKLVIDNGTTNVGPDWLTDRLNLFGAAQVNVVMQQENAGGFDTALTASTLSGWTFTSACAADEPSHGDSPVVMGSYFTHAWTRGLKLEVLPAGTPDVGQYADQLGTGSEGTNRLVSMEEAMIFGKEIHDHIYYGGIGIPSTPGYVEPTGGVPQYLGLPDLVIRDGSPFYESPDVTLTHPNHTGVVDDTDPANQDLYIPDPDPLPPPDYNNTVNVAVRNMGTHPVRAYSEAIELFQTGGDGIGDQYSECDIVPTGGVLFPMLPAAIGTAEDKKDTYLWNIPFIETSTHRCVKAEVELLCGDLDYSWSPSVEDNEAQRNIDILPLALSPPPSPDPPLPGNIKGMKEHIYNMKNPFAGPRDFALVFPEVYFQYREKIDMDWFQLPQGPQAERLPLVIEEEPVAHIPFSMQEEEERQILLSVRLKQGFEPEEDIRLPFEIIAGGPWDDIENLRAPAAVEQLPKFAAFAGFTVVIKRGAATLKGTVLGKDQQPAAGAKVLLRTVNDLQGAAITANEKGEFALEDINADIYYIQAESGDLHSREHMVVLQDGKVEEFTLPLTEPEPIPHQPVKVVVDKIRILDDKDPCIKGKGELVFTAVVVPDLDRERKQVTRLPEKGVYHVSDKPGKNEITLGVTIFKGVVKNRNLSITIGGKEIDCFDHDDPLTRYHRMFCGDPADWYGEYKPFDEKKDKEDTGDWAIWYRIIRD